MQVADLYAGLSLKADHASFEKGDKLLESIKTGLEIFAVAEVANGIREIFNGVSETAIAASRMAQKIGISTEAVQELGYAASTTGVSTEELQIGFTKMAKGLEEFRTKGTGPVGEALLALKIPLKEIKNDSPDQLLSTLADKFAAMPDGIHKTASAVDVFGRSGANLIPLLNKGGAGIADLRAEAERLGIVVDGKTTESFKELEETSMRVHGAITGFKNTLAIALLPTISKLADGLFKWVEANKEVIASDVKSFVDGLATAFGFASDAVGILIDGVNDIEDVFTAAFDGDEGAQALLIGVGWALTIAVLPPLIAAGIAAWSFAAGIIAAALPFILVGAEIALIAYGIIKLVKNWDKVKEVAVRVGSAIKGAFESAVGWVADKIQWIMDKLQALIDTAKGAANALTAPGRAVGNKIYDTIHGTANSQLDHSDENQDQSDAAIAKRKTASDEYYRMHPTATVNPSSSGGTVNNVAAVNLTVTVPPGTSSDASKKLVVDSMTDFWHGLIRDANEAHK